VKHYLSSKPDHEVLTYYDHGSLGHFKVCLSYLVSQHCAVSHLRVHGADYYRAHLQSAELVVHGVVSTNLDVGHLLKPDHGALG